MRTTLSLDDDVAALLKRAMARSKRSLKQEVNDALRSGLTARTLSARRTRVRTRSYNAGECLIGSIDDISNVLAIAEGDSFKWKNPLPPE